MFTNTGENTVFENIFRSASGVLKSLDAALWVGDPTDAANGGAEVTGGGYARQSVNMSTLFGVVGSGGGYAEGETKNVAALQFPVATGQWSGGSAITHLCFFLSSNMVMKIALDTPRAVDTNEQITFNIGEITLQLD